MTINHHSLILKQTVQFILILLLGYFFIIDFLDYKYFAIHLRYIPDVSTMT